MKKSLAILLVAVLLLSFGWSVSAAGVTTSASVNGREVTVSGTISDAASNQQVTIMVVKDGVARATATESDIAYINQDTFAGNSYTFTFEMPDSMTTGTYDVYVGGTGVSTVADTEFTLGSSATEAPTAAPTEAPTAAPSGATVTGSITIDAEKYDVTATANGDAVTITVVEGEYTITLPAAGNYEIVVSAPTMLDYTFNVTESQGTSIEGPSITPILGDIDGNGSITGADVSAIMGKLGASGTAFDPYMDVDGNGSITGADVSTVMGKLGASYN